MLYLAYWAVKFRDPLAAMERNLELIASPMPFLNMLRVNSWPAHHDVEFYILMTVVYATGILRLRRFPVLFAYSALQFLFYNLLSVNDWSRYYLSIAPFALIVGFHDVLKTRAFRWSFPLLAFLSVYWAQRSIPFNLCAPETYGQLLAYLGLSSGGGP